jgi:hypothetical protein
MSVLLKGRDGSELELAFVREALPDVQDGQGDSAWFTVVVRAETAEDSWEDTSPCLSSYEFHNLADWLEVAARGREGEVGEVDMLEPGLNFAITRQDQAGVGIRVTFELTQRPEELGVGGGDAPDHTRLDLYLERDVLLSAAAALNLALDEMDQEPRDDILGEGDLGVGGAPSLDLNLLDSIEPEPPGAGDGEDSAGNR